MRISAVLFLMISLAACKRGGVQSNDAVRQGVLDHLAESQAKTSLNLAAMDVELKSVTFNGNDADAAVSITPKGGNPAAGMSINYHLQQQAGKWVVVGRQDQHGAVAAPDAANPHGGGATPDAANPHGGGMAAPAGGGAKMPSPEDLPPTGKKK
ncbi:MAG TPA: hypothetical protein VGZ73_00680 [Bryobacteraceae bacterium]|nr:hypothetical protein [Bryobacteraceae bacterium]